MVWSVWWLCCIWCFGFACLGRLFCVWLLLLLLYVCFALWFVVCYCCLAIVCGRLRSDALIAAFNIGYGLFDSCRVLLLCVVLCCICCIGGFLCFVVWLLWLFIVWCGFNDC